MTARTSGAAWSHAALLLVARSMTGNPTTSAALDAEAAADAEPSALAAEAPAAAAACRAPVRLVHVCVGYADFPCPLERLKDICAHSASETLQLLAELKAARAAAEVDALTGGWFYEKVDLWLRPQPQRP